jgi:hypothetical protein
MFAIGLDYKRDKNFSAMFSPVTGKLTMVSSNYLANQGAFGVTKGKNQRLEAGGSVKASYNNEIMENISLQTKLELFSNYLEHPENIDVEWEIFISMKVNEYISANFKTQLIYDDDILIENDAGDAAPRLQIKEILGVGLTYDF